MLFKPPLIRAHRKPPPTSHEPHLLLGFPNKVPHYDVVSSSFCHGHRNSSTLIDLLLSFGLVGATASDSPRWILCNHFSRERSLHSDWYGSADRKYATLPCESNEHCKCTQGMTIEKKDRNTLNISQQKRSPRHVVMNPQIFWPGFSFPTRRRYSVSLGGENSDISAFQQ